MQGPLCIASIHGCMLLALDVFNRQKRKSRYTINTNLFSDSLQKMKYKITAKKTKCITMCVRFWMPQVFQVMPASSFRVLSTQDEKH